MVFLILEYIRALYTFGNRNFFKKVSECDSMKSSTLGHIVKYSISALFVGVVLQQSLALSYTVSARQKLLTTELRGGRNFYTVPYQDAYDDANVSSWLRFGSPSYERGKAKANGLVYFDFNDKVQRRLLDDVASGPECAEKYLLLAHVHARLLDNNVAVLPYAQRALTLAREEHDVHKECKALNIVFENLPDTTYDENLASGKEMMNLVGNKHAALDKSNLCSLTLAYRRSDRLEEAKKTGKLFIEKCSFEDIFDKTHMCDIIQEYGSMRRILQDYFLEMQQRNPEGEFSKRVARRGQTQAIELSITFKQYDLAKEFIEKSKLSLEEKEDLKDRID